jgi:hypothetical protein
VCKGFSGGQNLSGLLAGCFNPSGKPPDHETDQSKEDPGLLAALKDLIISGEPTKS